MKTIIDFANKVKSLADGRISNIANVEGTTSAHPYTVGKQLIFNGLLCKATSAIAVGDTLAVGTNLALSNNVVEQIYSLNQGLTNSLANISHENLLDNPWFTVNQRGQSSYTANNAYCVDRWKTVGASTDKEVKKVSNGLELKQNSSTSGAWNAIEQFIEHDDLIIGERYTISILYADGTIRSKVSLPLAETTSYTRFAYTDMYQDVVVNFDYQGNGGYFIIDIETKNSTVVDTVIRAVKLEKGTVSTLAMDTAPNYAEELLKCQRYFISFNPLFSNLGNGGAVGVKFDNIGAIALTVPIPVAMRAKPELSFTNYGFIVYGDGTTFTPSSVVVDDVYNNVLRVYVPIAQTAGNKICAWQDYIFTASAEL